MTTSTDTALESTTDGPFFSPSMSGVSINTGKPPLHPGLPKFTPNASSVSMGRFREGSLMANISMQLAMRRQEKKEKHCCHQNSDLVFYSTCILFYLGTMIMICVWIVLHHQGF
jgi:hypothetical protein